MTPTAHTIPIIALIFLAGCRRSDSNAPPVIFYGDSICAECGMIISDDRFGVATITEGERGTVTLLFDDFNCQFNHERDRSDLVIVRHWARDHGARMWLDPHSARFVFAPSLRTPMGSHLAVFDMEADAIAFAALHQGVVMGFEQARDAAEGR